ncbi:MAG TPA: hypothetical protein VF655_09235 [Allosphingosinicella sp.]|jgi:hypothetical protein
MEARTQILLTVAAAVAVWGCALVIVGPAPSFDLLKPFGATVSVVTLLAVIFSKWIWKWRILRNWVVKRPDLNGTWKADLHSTFEVDGERVKKSGFMVIKQDLSELSIRLYTDQAHSYSLAQNVIDRDGFFEVACVYLNVPTPHARAVQQSQIHHGALLLSHVGYDEELVEGMYWTDRETMGEIELSERRPTLVTSYRAGLRLYGE